MNKSFDVISGTNSEIKNQLNELNKEHQVVVTSTVIAVDGTLTCILFLNTKKAETPKV